MSVAARISEPPGCAAEPATRKASRFLEVNLGSLRLLSESRRAIRESASRGLIEVSSDGTTCFRDGSTRLGLPIAPTDVLSQLSDVTDGHVVVVFGMGTGQLPRAVRAMSKVPLVVYEPDPTVLRALLEFGPVDLGDIPIACTLSDLGRLWMEFGLRRVEVHVLTTPGYYATYPDAVRSFIDTIPTLLERTAISKATYQHRSKTWIEDIIANVELLSDSPPFLTLEGQYEGVPAFIIGAGPSLDKNIELLTQAAGKGIVFATNSGAASLAERGIEPQVVVCIESIDASRKLRDLPFMSRAVRAFSLSASPATLRTGSGPLLLVHEAVPQYDGPLRDLTGHAGLPVSNSVSTLAHSLARQLGCSPIVLVGQDLAYSEGRTYASGTGYESSAARVDEETGVIHLEWNQEALRAHGETHGALHAREGLRRVSAWGGQGEVDSATCFAGVHAWFEASAEAIAKSSRPIRLINATEGGVRILGYEELSLERVLAELPDLVISGPDIAAAARARWVPIEREAICAWLEVQARASRDVRVAARRVRRYASLAAKATLAGQVQTVVNTYECLERAELSLRAAVSRCPLVDAWCHREVDAAMDVVSASGVGAARGPHRAAEQATQKSAELGSAVERSARGLELALLAGAARVNSLPAQ